MADCKGSVTTCGYLIRLFGDVIAWKTQKRHYVSLSTCGTEYVAMSEACKELVALSSSLEKFISGNIYPMTLYYHKRAAIQSTHKLGAVGLRHLFEVRNHYVKECRERKRVEIEWVASEKQLADIFTKPLSFSKHERLTD